MIQHYKRKNDKCIICGKDLTKSRRLKTCDCDFCKKEYRRLHYKETVKEKTCLQCGQTYTGSIKSIYCKSCKAERLQNKTYDNIKQDVICSKCGSLIRTQYKKRTKDIPLIIYEFCDECKQDNKKQNAKISSERMKQYNPMKNKDVSKKVAKSIRKRYEEKCASLGINPKPYVHRDPNKIAETAEECSIRMKLNNPMKRPDIVEKMKTTLRNKIESGEIIYKKGKEHHLYKGNRPINKYVRDHLKKWIKIQLKNSNYTCQICGKTNTTLHVHHNIPLSKIIEKFLNQYNITDKNELIKNESLLELIMNDILLYHYSKENICIVVCKDCHNKIDKHYHKSRKNENS